MKIDIRKVSILANLSIPEQDILVFEKQLDETLTTIQRLNEVDTTDIIPTSQVTGLENVLREDIVKPSLSQEEALKNAKHTYNGFFVVPAVLEGE